jgi:hypothetical protein
LLPRIHYKDLNQKEQRIEFKGRERRSGTRGQASNKIKENKRGGEEGGSGGGGRWGWAMLMELYGLRIYSCHGITRVFRTRAYWAVSYGLRPGY